MDVMKRIEDLRNERGWSTYRLAIASGLSVSTIANIYRRHTIPSLATIEAICNAFGITLSQFFADDMAMMPLSPEQKQMFDAWSKLTPNQKSLIEKIIDEFK